MPKFYPGADKELSPPSKFKRISLKDGDKNKVALIIIPREAFMLNLLVTYLSERSISNGTSSVDQGVW